MCTDLKWSIFIGVCGRVVGSHLEAWNWLGILEESVKGRKKKAVSVFFCSLRVHGDPAIWCALFNPFFFFFCSQSSSLLSWFNCKNYIYIIKLTVLNMQLKRLPLNCRAQIKNNFATKLILIKLVKGIIFQI